MLNKAISVSLVCMLLLSGCVVKKTGDITSIAQTGIYQGKAIEGISEVAWTFQAKDYGDFRGFFSQPLVTEKYTFFGDVNGDTLYAVDTKNGEQKWSIKIAGKLNVPALTGKTLVYNDEKGIHAVEADNGNKNWDYEYKFPAHVIPRITVTSEKNAFIVEKSEDGRTTLKAIDLKTGKVNWEYGNTLSGFIPVLDNGKLYVYSYGMIYCVDTGSGNEVSSINLEKQILAFTVKDKRLYIVGYDGLITAYNTESNKEVWQYTNEDFGLGSLLFLTPLKDNLIVSRMNSGAVIALDSKTGQEIWKSKLGDEKYKAAGYPWIITSPSVLQNTLYFGVFDGEREKNKEAPAYSKFVAINGINGTMSWEQTMDDYIDYPPAFVNGKVIIADHKTIASYNSGKAIKRGHNKEQSQESTAQVSKSRDEEASSQASESIEDQVKQEDERTSEDELLQKYAGKWSTPSSDELAFNLEFIDDENGRITFYQEGEESPFPFKYYVEEYYVMLYAGEKEDTVIKIHYKEDGKIIFESNDQMISMERVG